MFKCTAYPPANPVDELNTLQAELEDAENRLTLADEEGAKVIVHQIGQIKRDIQRYSTKMKD